jgi:hypothetical protein
MADALGFAEASNASSSASICLAEKRLGADAAALDGAAAAGASGT